MHANIQASDTSGIYYYSVLEDTGGEDVIETSDARYAQSLRNQGYICMVADPSSGLQRCVKKVEGGFKEIGGSASNNFNIYSKAGIKDGENYQFRVAVEDNAGNVEWEYYTGMHYDAINPYISDLSILTGTVYSNVRYIDSSLVYANVTYTETRLDTASLKCNVGSTNIPCSYYSGPIRGTDTGEYLTMKISINIGNLSTSFTNDLRLSVSLSDIAGRVGYNNADFRKIDGSRKININDFSIRANSASIDNFISRNSEGNLEFKYTLSNEEYKNTNYTKISVGGSSFDDSNYSFANGSSYVNSGSVLSKDSAWLNRFTTGETATARIQFRNVYGQTTSRSTTVTFDYQNPDIDSIYLTREDGSSVQWTNNGHLNLNIYASDSSGIATYEAEQNKGGQDIIETSDPRYAQSLRNQGYICMVADPSGNGMQRCIKNIDKGYQYVGGIHSGNKITFYASIPGQDELFDIRGCAYDNAGNVTCRTVQTMRYDTILPVISFINITNGIVTNGNRYIDENKVYVGIKYSDSRLDTNYLDTSVSGVTVPYSFNYSNLISDTGSTDHEFGLCLDILTISVNFDSAKTIRVGLRDLAGNIVYAYIDFIRIDNSRKIEISNFTTKADEAFINNLISRKSESYIQMNYVLKDRTYLDTSYTRVTIGGDGDNYVFNDGSTFVESGTRVHKDKAWLDRYSTGSSAIAKIEFKNIYGQKSYASTSVVFDYTSPNINSFSVTGSSTYWTNVLYNQAKVSASDSNDIARYDLTQINITDVIETSDSQYAQRLKENGYICMIGSPDGETIQRCMKNNVSALLERSTSSNFSFMAESISDGSKFNFQITVYDNAGNSSITKYDNLSYDKSVPVVNNFELNTGNYIEYLDKLFTNSNVMDVYTDVTDIYSGIREITIMDGTESMTYEFNSNETNILSTLTFNVPRTNGIHKLYADIVDVAGNQKNNVYVGEYVYDDLVPTYDYIIENDYVVSRINYSYVLSENETPHYYNIKVSDIEYFYSVIDIDFVDIPDSYWLKESHELLTDNSKISLPRRQVSLYLRINNENNHDFAYNYLIGDGTNPPKYYYHKIKKNDLYKNGDRSVNESNVPAIASVYREAPNPNIYYVNNVLVWHIDPNDNNSLNLNKINFNEFSNVLSDTTNMRVFNIKGLTYNQDSLSTYAYDDVFITDYDHDNNYIIDVIILVYSPILNKDSTQPAGSTTPLVVNQGEEISNLGVNFVSPMSVNMNVSRVISLNGEKVDNIDTNVPGIYSIRNKATDLFGRRSYVDQTIVVKENKVVDQVSENIVKLNEEELQVIESNEKELIEEEKEIKTNSLIIAKLTKVEHKLVNNISNVSILNNNILFIFKLFSKYFFKIYDG